MHEIYEHRRGSHPDGFWHVHSTSPSIDWGVIVAKEHRGFQSMCAVDSFECICVINRGPYSNSLVPLSSHTLQMWLLNRLVQVQMWLVLHQISPAVITE